MDKSFVSFIQKLNSKREFHQAANISLKINNFGKALLISCNGKLESHAVKLPIGQVITSSVAYVIETNFANLTTKVSDAEMWKLKYEQEHLKTRELCDKASNAAITITKLQQRIRTLEDPSK